MSRAAAALVVVLVGLSVYLYMQVTDLQSQVSNYQMQNDQLEARIYQLQAQIYQFEADYQRLQSELNFLQAKYSDLQTSYYNLQNSYYGLEAENSQLRNLLNLYDEIPHDYYSSGPYAHHSNTYGELCSFLSWEFKLPRGYESNVFDCSEASACLEWALENAGFDAYIAVGPTPWNPAGRHSWVIVLTADRYKVPIESTMLTSENLMPNLFFLLISGRTPGVIYGNDAEWQNYSAGYDRLFKNIYEAARNCGSVQEWDWWAG